MLKGPRPEDAALLAAFERSAKRFGVRIVETPPFVLGRDPRERSQNNVALLTAGPDYDVVAVIDTDGEFARDVPYQVQRPRPGRRRGRAGGRLVALGLGAPGRSPAQQPVPQGREAAR